MIKHKVLIRYMVRIEVKKTQARGEGQIPRINKNKKEVNETCTTQPASRDSVKKMCQMSDRMMRMKMRPTARV